MKYEFTMSRSRPRSIMPQVVSATLLLDLRAAQLALNDNDLISTWTDASGLGHHFTQSGTARPTYRAGGGIPYVEFDGVDDWLGGGEFADNLDSFTVFLAINSSGESPPVDLPICKINSTVSQGWDVSSQGSDIQIRQNASNYYNFVATDTPLFNQFNVVTAEFKDRTHQNIFYNSILQSGTVYSAGAANYSTAEPVRLGTDGAHSTFAKQFLYAILIYSPAPNTADRRAIEAWLAGNP